MGNPLKRAALDYWYELLSLFDCPQEIWFAYAIKVVESVCYFASVLVLMSFLANEMGLSDTMAGTTFSLFSASMSFFMLLAGFIADSIGIKRALITGLFVALLGRLAIPWVIRARADGPHWRGTCHRWWNNKPPAAPARP